MGLEARTVIRLSPSPTSIPDRAVFELLGSRLRLNLLSELLRDKSPGPSVQTPYRGLLFVKTFLKRCLVLCKTVMKYNSASR
jgi:hypothetical protein